MTRFRRLVTFGALLVLPFAAAAAADAGEGDNDVRDGSYVLPDGERVLRLSVDVPAPAEAVWKAFTTSEGFRSWGAPVAKVDFRLDGTIESSYRRDAKIGDPANILNRIVAYLPGRMLAIRNVRAPPDVDFDAATFQALHTVITLKSLGAESTRVTMTEPGYRAGPAYDVVYRKFRWGNRVSLENLARRFRDGPIDWSRSGEEGDRK